MAKTRIFKLLGIVAVTTSLPLASMVSCNDKFELDFKEPILEGDQKTFSFIGDITGAPKKGVTVEILGSDSYLGFLNIANPVVYGSHGKIEVKIKINDDFNVDYTFNFSLRFTNNDTNEKITIDKFSIILRDTPIEEDVVRIEERSLEQTFGYHFIYKFYFSAMPKEKVYLSIPGGAKNISVEEEANVQREGDFYVLYAKVNVDIHVAKSFITKFELKLDFKNSFGKDQSEEFNECTLRFYADKNQRSIPYDYFVINNDNVLTGINSQVSAETIKMFDTLDIPKGVTSVAENVFSNNTNAFDFSNITTIIFPNTITSIPKNCFSGLRSLFYIDITSYSMTSLDDWPEWFNTSTPQNSVFSTTPKESFWYNGGIVWCNLTNFAYRRVKQLNISRSFGWDLSSNGFKWGVCSSQNVVPSNYYEIETDENGDVVLTGIKEEYKNKVGNYTVIQIPDEVNVIKEGALSAFKECKTREERRFIPSRNLKRLDKNALSFLSLGSHILFDCPKLESFGEKAFESASFWTNKSPQTSIDYAKSTMFLKGCNNFKRFEKLCFNTKSIDGGADGWAFEGKFVVPKSLEYAGETLFCPAEKIDASSDSINELIFEDCENLEFGLQSLWQLRNLTTIDLSQVSYDHFMAWKTNGNKVLWNAGLNQSGRGTIYLPSDATTQEQKDAVRSKLFGTDYNLDSLKWNLE